MRLRAGLLPAACLTLSACVTTGEPETDQTTGFIAELPEGVLAIAAPHQDLTSVRVLPEDGCYWYRHDGPVETTMLPLITTSGRPICTRPQTTPPAS